MVYDIELNIRIKANKEKVFNALTTPTGILGWWGAVTDISPKLQSVANFNFADKYYHKILISSLVPNTSMQWKVIEAIDEWSLTTIIWTLDDNNGETLVKLSHINFAEQTKIAEYCQQKWNYFLESLRDYCETSCGKPWVDNEEAEKEKQFIESLDN